MVGSPGADAANTPAEELVRALAALGVRVVVFDMDQTMVAMHCRGRLLRTDLANFASRATPDFVAAARALAAAGFKLAVATHSDAAEHCAERPLETHIIGKPLAEQVLRAAVPEIAHLFYIVGYNQRARGNTSADDAGKKYHIKQI